MVKLAKCVSVFFVLYCGLVETFSAALWCVKTVKGVEKKNVLIASKVYFPLLRISCIFMFISMQSVSVQFYSFRLVKQITVYSNELGEFIIFL